MTPSTLSARRVAASLFVAAIAALAIVAALRSDASAQDPAGRTLTYEELDRGSTFTHIRNTKTRSRRANSQGDLIVFVNPVSDAAGKVVGRQHVQCVTTVGARDFRKSKLTCAGIVVLPGGTLALQAITSPGVATTTGAIAGGTGAYANARGVFVSRETRTGSDTTITLTG